MISTSVKLCPTDSLKRLVESLRCENFMNLKSIREICAIFMCLQKTLELLKYTVLFKLYQNECLTHVSVSVTMVISVQLKVSLYNEMLTLNKVK